MQKALCNISIEPTETSDDHYHICSLDHGHKSNVHLCRCGVIFASVKKAELEKPLQKVQ